MKSIGKLLAFVTVATVVVFAAGNPSARATEVLANVGLEDSAGPANWTITQSITGEPGVFVNAYEHVDQANEPMNEPGELGILIKPFAGNVGTFEGQNKKVNVILTQTVAAPPGTYTLTGHSYFQAAASNIVDTLFEDSPSGAIASPTESHFTMEFLNASNTVLGMQTLDLRDDTTTEAWRTHTLMGTAPAGTTKVRVTASATDMVASCTTSCPAGQDVRIDNFTLRNSTSPTFERLANNELNQLGAPSGWAIEKTEQDNLSFSGNPSFAAHAGSVGMWLRSFAAGDAKILQTVPGTPGGEYTFSAWSKWETGYNGADPFSSTQTFMTMEFLDATSAVIGAPVSLDLRSVQVNDGTWRQLSLPAATAPAGTASVRVSAGATGMANSGINPQSAFFDDFSLMLATVGVPGDYNGNGTVDAADYVLWRNGGPLQNEVVTPGSATPEDYTEWRARFGNTAGSGSALAGTTAVPEPAAFALAMFAMLIGAGLWRR